MKTGMEEFVPIEKLEAQYTLSPPHPPRRRRRGLYISDSSDEEIKEEINVEGIDGDETGGEEADEGVNMEEGVEEVIDEVGGKVVRTRSGREVKRARISLPYYGEMEDRRIEGLGYRAKPKIARRRRG
jgi:hypothetical protein